MINLSDIRQKVGQIFKPTPEKRFDNFNGRHNDA